MTPKTGPRPTRGIIQVLSSHCPTYTPLSFLGSQRIRASGIVLLETILFGFLLLYFPVSLWPELTPASQDPHSPYLAPSKPQNASFSLPSWGNLETSKSPYSDSQMAGWISELWSQTAQAQKSSMTRCVT